MKCKNFITEFSQCKCGIPVARLFGNYFCKRNPFECLITIVFIKAARSMPVPRFWLEQTMESGTLSDNYISILSDSLAELSQVAHPKGQLSYGLLIALALTNDNAKEWSFGRDAGGGSMDEILSKARQVLIERPELMSLANLINEAAKQAPSKENIL